ncbi:MAG: hypothetical protein M3Q82_06070 [Actinomycetota bacterium]|nr:hypothetical protein [Actinomycetota bacterium]
MTVIAHHAGEELILTAALGSGLLSGSLLVLRARLAELARRRWRRHP